MKNKAPSQVLTEDAIVGDQALVEEIRSSQSGEQMTVEEFYAWLDSRP